ncbi:MAG TPA: hypothetical protein VGK21_02150 [Candidatus Angelobacter sp.]
MSILYFHQTVRSAMLRAGLRRKERSFYGLYGTTPQLPRPYSRVGQTLSRTVTLVARVGCNIAKQADVSL